MAIICNRELKESQCSKCERPTPIIIEYKPLSDQQPDSDRPKKDSIQTEQDDKGSKKMGELLLQGWCM